MKRALHELSEVEKSKVLEGLAIPVGEFAAMFSAALMTLALLFAPATIVTAARKASPPSQVPPAPSHRL